MVTVAVAGAATGMGSVIIHELLSSKKHEVVVLSRSEQPSLSAIGATVRVVDYNSMDQLVAALSKVHTVLSCIWIPGPDLGPLQLRLLEASQKASVKRFVPSDWAIDRYDEVALYNAKTPVWDAVKASGLEYTRFIPGQWMNLFGVGSPDEKAVSAYRGPCFLVDIKAGTALLPGDGSQKVVFTEMKDVAKFVVASLDLDHWDPDSRLVGDRKSYTEVVELAEKITGRTFHKTYVPMEEIQKVLDNDPDAWTRFFYEYKRLVGKGHLDFNGNLNERFPDIKAVTMQEYLEKYWS